MDQLNNSCRVYEPEILQTMGIAFDTAWDVLSNDSRNQNSKSREMARLELSGVIFHLVDAGETDALFISRLTLETFWRSDVRRAKENTQSDLVAWIGLRLPTTRRKQGVSIQDTYSRAGNFSRVGSGHSA